MRETATLPAAAPQSAARQSVQSTAYAKLNLALHVTGRRADGYHLLDTLVAFTTFGDELTIAPAQLDNFSLHGPFSACLPVNGDNLVLKARDLLRQHFPQQSFPVDIQLVKNLPVASGIGGGSSDAAAALALLIRLWQIEPEPALIQQLCLQLGADVPMCMHGQLQGGALIAKGIGEEIHSLDKLPRLPLVLVNDGTAISTPQIFQNMQRRDNPPLPDRESLHSLAQVISYLRSTRNDLLAPAITIAPQLPHILRELEKNGAQFVQMSGSGATCFGIFETFEQAQIAARNIQQQNPQYFVCATETLPLKHKPELIDV